jgi:hypothetical protein
MNWTVLYTPKSSGTVLSPDNYHTTHNSKLFAFYHLGSNNGGKIGFLDHNKQEVESIQMKRTDNGEWLTLPAVDADVKPNLIPVLKTRRILQGKVLANFLSNVSNILPPTTESNNTFHTH